MILRFYLFTFLFFSNQALADSDNSLLEIHEQVSDYITGVANRIDSFFGSVKDQEVYNKTKLRFYQTFTKVEGEDLENKFNFRLSLDLPNLKNKFRFSLERSEKDKSMVSTSEEVTTEREREIDRLRASFSFLTNELANFNMRFSTGVRIDIPPTPFAEYKISRNFPMGKWNLRFFTNSFWSHRNGFGQSFALDWELGLARDVFFRFINEATWQDSSDKLISAHGPTIYHTLSERRMMAYKALVNYINRPHVRVEGYDLIVSYRQELKSKILFYEVIPNLSFARASNFHSEGKLTVQLELVF